jgi:hypothetical protein
MLRLAKEEWEELTFAMSVYGNAKTPKGKEAAR